MKRRDFLQQTGLGLAMIGVSGLVLRSDSLQSESEFFGVRRIFILLRQPRNIGNW